jgi:hypothetical protein
VSFFGSLRYAVLNFLGLFFLGDLGIWVHTVTRGRIDLISLILSDEAVVEDLSSYAVRRLLTSALLSSNVVVRDQLLNSNLPNSLDSWGVRELLEGVITDGNPDRLEFLLNLPIPFNVLESWNLRALLKCVIAGGNLDMLELFLNSPLPFNVLASWDLSALLEDVIADGNPDRLELLLNSSLPFNVMYSHDLMGLLKDVIAGGNLDRLELFLNSPLPFNVMYPWGLMGVLKDVIAGGNLDMLELFLNSPLPFNVLPSWDLIRLLECVIADGDPDKLELFLNSPLPFNVLESWRFEEVLADVIKKNKLDVLDRLLNMASIYNILSCVSAQRLLITELFKENRGILENLLVNDVLLNALKKSPGGKVLEVPRIKNEIYGMLCLCCSLKFWDYYPFTSKVKEYINDMIRGWRDGIMLSEPGMECLGQLPQMIIHEFTYGFNVKDLQGYCGDKELHSFIRRELIYFMLFLKENNLILENSIPKEARNFLLYEDQCSTSMYTLPDKRIIINETCILTRWSEEGVMEFFPSAAV